MVRRSEKEKTPTVSQVLFCMKHERICNTENQEGVIRSKEKLNLPITYIYTFLSTVSINSNTAIMYSNFLILFLIFCLWTQVHYFRKMAESMSSIHIIQCQTNKLAPAACSGRTRTQTHECITCELQHLVCHLGG